MTTQRNFCHPIIFALFLISGFCGLLYQIVWTRLAFATFGIITPVLSVVISVFMLGLALGSWLGGRAIEKVSGKTGISPIVVYALAECIIGIGGISVPAIFAYGQTWLLPAGDFNSFRYLLLSAVVLAVSILPWCVAMGATVPLMMAFIRKTNRAETKGFSYLYLANVIGAMCGTVITAIFLIELLGLHRTLLVAACANFAIAITSLTILLAVRTGGQEAVTAEKTAGASSFRATAPLAKNPRTVYIILFITGFSSMAMEVVWSRAFTPLLSTTIYAFAFVLAVYLLATWIGSFGYRRDADKGMVRDIPQIMAHLCIYSFLPIVFSDPRVWRLASIHGSKISRAIFAVSSIFPFCMTLGYLTPKLIDGFSHGSPERAGKAYAVNVLGCILGPLAAGYALLPVVGVKFSLVTLAVPFVIFFMLYEKELRIRSFVYTRNISLATGLLSLGSIFLLTSFEDGMVREPSVVRRDYVATVISTGEGREKRLLTNGITMTTLTTITKFMAHVPLAIRDRKPESALVICFGMGTTFRSAASWDIDVTAVELVPSVPDAFGYYFNDADAVRKKPNVRILIDDGRRFLMRTTKKYDIITIDPPPPVQAAGSSLLYSEEFYTAIKMRLKEGGILSQWLPGGEKRITQAVAKSLGNAFPYIRIFRSYGGRGYHFFTSMEPFEMPTAEEFLSRLPAEARADLTEWEPGRSPQELYGSLVQRELAFGEIVTPDVTFSITDDRPFNEYYILRRCRSMLRKDG